jgi:hypothetical protein
MSRVLFLVVLGRNAGSGRASTRGWRRGESEGEGLFF